MDWTSTEQKLTAFQTALESDDAAAAYLCCAQLLQALVTDCYLADGKIPPETQDLFAHLPETRLGNALRPNFDAYVRICARFDIIYKNRKAEEFPQYTDGKRLLARMQQLQGESV